MCYFRILTVFQVFFKVALYLIKEGTFVVGYSLDFLAIRATLSIFTFLSIIALVVGIVYLVVAEVEDKSK